MLIFADVEVADGCDSVVLEWVRLGTTEEMVHHQQKSTFLIPSYSILLHLIPLILGVRRE